MSDWYVVAPVSTRVPDVDLAAARDLAIELAQKAGDLAVQHAASAAALPKGHAGDVVTHVDQEAERLIAAAINAAYPAHAVLGEEFGLQGDPDAEYRWLVDPLDGTNNYVLGLDLYGVCITLCRRGEPLVAVVHDSARGRSYAAIVGHGATLNGTPVRMLAPEPLDRVTVSWLQGYAVGADDPAGQRMFRSLERSCKRVLRTWAPSIDWGLIAVGRVAAMIAYRNEPWDLVGGALIAREAGADVLTSADGEIVLVAHPDIITELAALVGIE